MTKNLWFGGLVVILAGMMCFSIGCRKKRTTSGRETIGGTIGESDQEQSMFGPRPGEMKILADVTMDAVLFDYDSAQISESERSKLEAVADYLKQNSRVGVIIEGHCDERGSAEYNMALGERRALAARAYLIGLGMDAAAMQTRSLGEENPVNPGHDESSWGKNRRDEFIFFEQ